MGQLEDMQVFVRIVESGSITRAAEQLGQAKSAVSKRLKELETQLSVRLLHRTTRHSSLTEQGRLYYQRAKACIDEVAALHAEVRSDSSALSGPIKMAAPLSFGVAHLSPAIDLFCQQHPELTLDLDFSDRQVDIVEEGFDLALRIGYLKDSSLQARRIAPIQLKLVASPDYLSEYGIPKDLAGLAQHKFLAYDGGANTRIVAQFKDQEYTQQVSASCTANNGDFLRHMAVAGHGITLLPTFISWQSIATGDLVTLLDDWKINDMHAYAVYPPSRFRPQKVRAWVEFLVERFGERPYWDQF